MFTGVHILLTYSCPFQCEHCFLHCEPGSGGSFTFLQLGELLDQASQVDSVRRIAFEGGEPFLLYPLLVEGIRKARMLGYETEVVTNGYWALNPQDARKWLTPLVDAGLDILDVSDDAYHHGEMEPTPAKSALEAAESLGLTARSFAIDPPRVRSEEEVNRGEPIVGGGVRFRGRAADKLAKGLPLTANERFAACPDEDLVSPGRAHVDAYGNVQLCQGLSIGNVWKSSLWEILQSYDPETHPVCGPLMRGGPAQLAREFDADVASSHVDACHLCYNTRAELRERLPECLVPGQAYGK